MAALSYSTAARIATRELRSSPGKFAFVLLSVAIGVAALTGVRGFSASFRSMLLLRARSIMAADLGARMFEATSPGEQAALDKLAGSGLDETPVTEMLSMASSSTSLDPLLVDPATGAAIGVHALPLHLRRARTTRVSVDANAGVCRGLLRERYPNLRSTESEEKGR